VNSDFAKSENKQDQEYFESLLQKELTPSRGFSKVVVSRKEIIETDSFDLVSVFEKLIQSYPMLLLLLVSKNRLWMEPHRNDYLKLRTSFLL
jgi:isochorismate synthase